MFLLYEYYDVAFSNILLNFYFRRNNAYVATQGPLQETASDFWRMCWELRCATIVMMTRLEERARIKCDQYWPTRGSDVYGQMTVTTVDVQVRNNQIWN